MKNRRRIFVAIALLAIVFSAFSVYALATNDTPQAAETVARKTAEEEGYFLYYDASKGEFLFKENEDFKTVVNAMDRGDTIKLLSDLCFVVDKNASDGSVSPSTNGESGSDSLYIDLNGFQLSMQYIHWAYTDDTKTIQRGAGHGLLISPTSNTTLCVYSSDAENMATMRAVHTLGDGTEKDKAGAIFGISGGGAKNTHIYLGDVENAKVLSYDGIDENGSVVGGSVTTQACDGDNLSTYAPTLFSSEKSNGGNVPFTNCAFYVGGGNHYQSTDLGGAVLLNLYCQVDVYAEGASFISTIGSTIVKFQRDDSAKNVVTSGDKKYYSYAGDANVEMKNCLLYTEGTVISELYESVAESEYNTKDSHVKFEDCSLIGSTIQTIKRGTPEYINCKFSTLISEFESNGATVLARNNLSEVVKLYAAEKQTDKDGKWTGFYDIKNVGEDLAVLDYAIVDPENCVDITWKSQGNTVSEKWIKGADVYPVPAFTANSSEVYTYDYSPKITSTAESGNRTYTLTPNINFAIQANVSLHADFTFNLYIPKKAGDSALMKSARIEREGKDPVTVIIPEQKTLAIAGEEHYVISQEIFANDGDAEYSLVLEMEGYSGETITYKRSFSIFDYADRVSAAADKGAFPLTAKTLVNATKTYIKAAMNYFTKDGEDIPYTDIDVDALKQLTLDNASATQTTNGKAEPVLSGATLSPLEKIYFLFEFESLEDAAKQDFINKGYANATVTYPVNLKGTTESVNVLDGGYLMLPVRAIDLRGTIKFDVDGDGKTDYTYSIKNYFNFVKSSTNDNLIALCGSMWAYSEAAHAYLTGDSSDTPVVNFSVAGEKITAENYVIVAGDEENNAALALQAAILTKTGENLSIVTEAQEGKNSIYINLTKPTHGYDFKVSVDGHDLVMDCSFGSFIDSGISAFINEHISTRNSSFDFASSFVDNYYTDKIYYSDFGVPTVDMTAVEAAGITTDINKWYNDDVCCGGTHTVLDNIKAAGLLETALDALIKAHNFVNVGLRHTICADEGAVYYINTVDVTGSNQIVIKTNVNWEGAQFILDDSELESSKSDDVFFVKSYIEDRTITDKAILDAIASEAVNLTPATKKINLALGYRAMLVTLNSEHKVFRRQGSYRGSGNIDGVAMQELIVIDANGNVDPTTPPIFTYANLDSLTVYNLDVPEITINGGKITTIVPEFIKEGRIEDRIQIGRGLNVTRPNTRVQNLDHNIIGEHKKQTSINGATYTGFFCATDTSDVTFYNCKLQGRRLYASGRSSYEISVNMVNNCSFDTCEQTNFYVNPDTYFVDPDSSKNTLLSMTPSEDDPDGTSYYAPCWGTMGGNDMKNFAYVNSRIARLDAHRGLYNGKVVNSDVQRIAIGGWGDFTVENSNIHSSGTLFELRSDYGFTWNGTLTAKNVAALYKSGQQSIVSSQFTNWDFGYVCQFPDVLIDGLTYHTTLGTMNLNKPGTTTSEHSDPVASSTVGPINMYKHDFATESNLHLEVTEANKAIYKYMIYDADKDGIMDGSENFPWVKNADGTETIAGTLHNTSIKATFTKTVSSTSEVSGISYSAIKDKAGDYLDYGFRYNGGYENLNPIKAPSSIIVLNNSQGYDYKTYLNNALAATPYIYNEETRENEEQPNFFANTVIAFDDNKNGTIEEDEYIKGAHTHTGADAVIENEIAATCTEDGSYDEVIYCSVCNLLMSRVTKTTEKLGHDIVTDAAVEPTCTSTGLTEGSHCSICDEVLVAQKTVDALGHTEVVDKAVEPTCAETGLTEGKHCSVCNAVLVAQKVVDALAHTEVVDEAVEPTCTETGLTEGKHCSVCNEVLVAQKVIEALGHTEVSDGNAKAPGCESTGLTASTHCSVCGETIAEQEVVDALGHTEVIDEAVEPTCTETGLTEGKHCSVCNKVLVEQEVVDALGHTEVIDKAVEPTCTETGLTEGKHCSVCNEVLVAQEVVAALGHTVVVDEAVEPTCTEDGLTEGSHCSACGEVLVEQVTVPAAHTVVVDEAVEPTCTEDGLTEGSHCSACGEVLVAQETVPATGHNYVDGECTECHALEPGCKEEDSPFIPYN